MVIKTLVCFSTNTRQENIDNSNSSFKSPTRHRLDMCQLPLVWSMASVPYAAGLLRLRTPISTKQTVKSENSPTTADDR